MAVTLKRLCPQCGARMKVVTEEEWKYLRCTACPLDFGRRWFHKESELIEAWENMPKNKLTSGRTRKKGVVKVDRNGTVIETYSSICEAADKNPLSRTAIKNRLNGKVKGNEYDLSGYTFRLADE